MHNRPERNRSILFIGGFDPSGGAGISADIKTASYFGVDSLAIIENITNQTDNNFIDIQQVDLLFIINQIDNLFHNYQIDWLKIGLVSTTENLKVIIERILEKNSEIKIVIDPIQAPQLAINYPFGVDYKYIIKSFSDNVVLITPNYIEAEKLNQVDIPILVKGGHNPNKEGSSTDVLKINNNSIGYFAKKLDNVNLHGTGCLLSSAIACNLFKGLHIQLAIGLAKAYVYRHLKVAKNRRATYGSLLDVQIEPIYFEILS
jgi:hydroxymethylpyrimidine/phosphomethylpyrimidine kinase